MYEMLSEGMGFSPQVIADMTPEQQLLLYRRDPNNSDATYTVCNSVAEARALSAMIKGKING